MTKHSEATPVVFSNGMTWGSEVGRSEETADTLHDGSTEPAAGTTWQRGFGPADFASEWIQQCVVGFAASAADSAHSVEEACTRDRHAVS
mmetsp:Transcript_8053/g.23898  ORF Transcript_8053/g.23898 Transcript_8053/m.23898 type:complete len:90 (+) Transcript_8053:6166-6435(+)